ncbi:MAG: hypothetical protein AAF290_14175 [Pseudomonadota bacterium]
MASVPTPHKGKFVTETPTEQPEQMSDNDAMPDKKTLIRDAIAFQIKLIIDGLRDVVLIPVSLIATVMSLIKPGDKAGSEFYDVVAFGKETERKINLFGAAPERSEVDSGLPEGDVDQVIAQVEQYLSQELQGDRFSQARAGLEKTLDRLRRQFGRSDSDV